MGLIIGLGICLAIVAALACVFLALELAWASFAQWWLARFRDRVETYDAAHGFPRLVDLRKPFDDSDWPRMDREVRASRRMQAGIVDLRMLWLMFACVGCLALIGFVVGVYIEPRMVCGGIALGLFVPLVVRPARMTIGRWWRRRRLWLIVRKAVDDEKIMRDLRHDREFVQRVVAVAR
jgi:hypothetical protein